MAVYQAKGVMYAIEVTKDAYTPLPEVSEAYDSNVCILCNTIGRKLKHAGYTLLDLQSVWRRSRQNAESIEIICDLTALKEYEVRYALGLGNTNLVVEDIGMSDYWVRSPKTKARSTPEC